MLSIFQLLNVIVVFLSFWVLPGFLIASILFRNDKISITERITIGSAINISISSLIALFLGKAHLFYKECLIILVALVYLISIALLYIRRKICDLRECIKAKFTALEPSSYLLILVLFIITIPQSWATFAINNGASAPSWRYLADSILIAKSGGIPTTSYQWLSTVPFITNKLFFYLFTAGHLILLEGLIDYVLFMEFFTIVMLLFCVIFSYSFFKTVYNDVIAVFALVFTFINPFFATIFIKKFSGFYAEGFAIMLMFGILYLYVKWRHSNSWKYLPLVLTTLCIQGLVHLVPFVLTIIYIFCLAFLELLFVRKRKTSYQFFKIFFILLASVAFSWFIPKLVVPAGDPYQSIILDDRVYTAYNGYDPTYEFLAKLASGGHREIKTSGFYIDPWSLFNEIFVSTLNIEKMSDAQTISILSIIILVLVFLACLKYNKKLESRCHLLSSFLLFICLYLMSILFSYRYSVWVLAQFIDLRFFPYISWVYIVSICTLLEGLNSQMEKTILKIKRLKVKIHQYVKTLNARWLLFFSHLLVLLFFLSLLFTPWLKYIVITRPDTLTSEAYSALTWIKENTGRNDIILLNERTTGIIEVLAERRAVIEGLATYLQPNLLIRSLGMLDEVENFYTNLDPTVICKYNVSYVIFSERLNAFMGHTPYKIRVAIKNGELPSFDSLTCLEKVQVFDTITIYKVKKECISLLCKGSS
jgi:hypothetical protein